MEADSLCEAEQLDSRILRRLQTGGVEELSQQFMQLRPSIRMMIASQIHGKLLSRLDASDIVQETFIRATRSLTSYLADPKIHPAIWLRLLSKQVMAEAVRTNYRQIRNLDMETVNFADGHLSSVLADSQESVGKRMEKAEEIRMVNKLLTEISVTDREILNMRHAEGFSFQEIGDLLEISMEAAKKRYYRALDRFRVRCTEFSQSPTAE